MPARAVAELSALHRYESLAEGRIQRKARLDSDERPGELSLAVARAKAGDGAAIRYLYLRFSGNVLGFVLSIVHDEHAAEDVTQQVFARMISALPGYQERGVPFSAWLLRIAQNLAIDHMRRQRTTPYEDVHGGEDVADELRGAELAQALRDSLSALPDGQREVVALRQLAGLTPGEIAKRLGKSEQAVHALHHRGRRQLKRELSRRDVAPVAAG